MATRSRMSALGATLLAAAGLAGCRQDMQNQPKYIPLRSSSFWADGRSARLQPTGTVGRGQLREDNYFYTGKINGQEGTMMPFPTTPVVLARGQERYNIYCTPCHSRVGDGNGMIVQRGYRAAGNFHVPRLVNAPVGHFFDVITNGYGAMPDYAAQISPADRWAIVAYIRALQLSQAARLSDVPPEMRDRILDLKRLYAQNNEVSGGVRVDNQMEPPGPPNPNASTQSSAPSGPVGGQQGHPNGGDNGPMNAVHGNKGERVGHSQLPNGEPQSGPNYPAPQTGQAEPQGSATSPNQQAPRF